MPRHATTQRPPASAEKDPASGQAGRTRRHVEGAAQKRHSEPGESAELTADEDKRPFLFLLILGLQETGIKTIPMEKKCKKAKWLSGEALQIAVKR